MKRLGILVLWGTACVVGCGRTDDRSGETHDAVVHPSCGALSVTALNENARKFVFAEGLGKPSDEKQVVPDLIELRWVALRIVAPLVETRRSSCLVVMNLAMVTNDGDETSVEPSEPYEVIAIDPKTRAFSRFEKAVVVPAQLHAAFGPHHLRRADDTWEVATPNAFYYVELSGAAVLDTWKAIATGIQYSGLVAEISATNVKNVDFKLTGEPDGKVEFDPTADRTWKLKNASYSLRRGKTGESLDVYATQLDGAFDAYFSGSNGKVGPWDSGVRRWKRPASTTWTDTPLPAPEW